MKFLSKLLKKNQPKSDPEPVVEIIPPQKPEPKRTEPVYLTSSVTFGMRRDEDCSICFVDENRGIRKVIVDSCGIIQNFPGIVKEDFWVEEVVPNFLQEKVRFRSEFEKRENGWIFLWQMQPDGMYWADDGGFDFTGPFRIYKVGSRGYAMDRFLRRHASSQKRALEATNANEPPTYYPDDIFPQLLGGWTNYIDEEFYHLQNRQETLEYWHDPILSHDMKELTQAMLDSGKTLHQMMGRDSYRAHASMTLFWLVTEDPIFKQMLDKFFEGKLHEPTVNRLNKGV